VESGGGEDPEEIFIRNIQRLYLRIWKRDSHKNSIDNYQLAMVN